MLSRLPMNGSSLMQEANPRGSLPLANSRMKTAISISQPEIPSKPISFLRAIMKGYSLPNLPLNQQGRSFLKTPSIMAFLFRALLKKKSKEDSRYE